MKKLLLFVVVLFFSFAIVSAASQTTDVELTSSGNASGETSLTYSSLRGISKIHVKVQVEDLDMEIGKVFEGWLVDEETEYKLSLGLFQTRNNGKGTLSFRQQIVNPFVYDKVVITKEPLNDIDPNPGEEVLSGDVANSVHDVITLKSNIRGNNQVPSVATRGKGSGIFWINTTENTVKFQINYSELSTEEISAHIHGFAQAGENAGVLFELPIGDMKEGIWNYSDMADKEADIIAGMTYVNIHSEKYPNGEIRGQIIL